MSKSYKIDGELIKSSGEKLKRIGYLMISQVVLLCLYYLVVLISRNIDTIQEMSVLSIITSIGIWIFIVRYFIQSGNGFIQSVHSYYEDGEYKEYYPNGKLKEIGTFKDGKQNGSYEKYHNHFDGQLVEKGTYKDGERDGQWVFYNDRIRITERSGLYENGVKVSD
jgi:hypothetical protein